MTTRRGRPALPPGEERTIRLQVRLTPAEYAVLVAMAGGRGRLSEHVRAMLLEPRERAR